MILVGPDLIKGVDGLGHVVPLDHDLAKSLPGKLALVVNLLAKVTKEIRGRGCGDVELRGNDDDEGEDDGQG